MQMKQCYLTLLLCFSSFNPSMFFLLITYFSFISVLLYFRNFRKFPVFGNCRIKCNFTKASVCEKFEKFLIFMILFKSWTHRVTRFWFLIQIDNIYEKADEGEVDFISPNQNQYYNLCMWLHTCAYRWVVWRR